MAFTQLEQRRHLHHPLSLSGVLQLRGAVDEQGRRSSVLAISLSDFFHINMCAQIIAAMLLCGQASSSHMVLAVGFAAGALLQVAVQVRFTSG